MSGLLGVATVEEFLDLFRVLWFGQLLAYLLVLVAVVRLWKSTRLRGGLLLMAGFGFLILAELMSIATQRELIVVAYSPSYAAMVEEWEMAGPDWQWWEPVYWWSTQAVEWLGLLASGVGFVLAGRGMVQLALQRQWEEGQPQAGGKDAG